jgi:hypothetical protein
LRGTRAYLPFSHPRASPAPTVKGLALMTRAFFVVTFLSSAWLIFLVLVRSNGWIPSAVRPHIGFVWNEWGSNPFEAFYMANVGLVVQHSWGQIVYISLLLLAIGIRYEMREGTVRTLLMFYGACLSGVAVLSVVILTTWVNGPHGWNHHLASTSWSGASVGCFGLLGATIATSRNPWPLLAVWATYEGAVEWILVPGLAVTMHIAGFVFGFAASRWIHATAPARAPAPLGAAAKGAAVPNQDGPGPDR